MYGSIYVLGSNFEGILIMKLELWNCAHVICYNHICVRQCQQNLVQLQQMFQQIKMLSLLGCTSPICTNHDPKETSTYSQVVTVIWPNQIKPFSPFTLLLRLTIKKTRLWWGGPLLCMACTSQLWLQNCLFFMSFTIGKINCLYMSYLCTSCYILFFLATPPHPCNFFQKVNTFQEFDHEIAAALKLSPSPTTK